jgi:hypothetical protein
MRSRRDLDPIGRRPSHFGAGRQSLTSLDARLANL